MMTTTRQYVKLAITRHPVGEVVAKTEARSLQQAKRRFGVEQDPCYDVMTARQARHLGASDRRLILKKRRTRIAPVA